MVVGLMLIEQGWRKVVYSNKKNKMIQQEAMRLQGTVSYHEPVPSCPLKCYELEDLTVYLLIVLNSDH